MKSRIYQLLLSLLLIICAATPATAQKVVLSHGGALTFYDTGDMTKALDAAVKNDTIFLPEAPIAGFTVTKDITIMGNGNKSAILGDVVVAPDDTVRWENALLDGVFVGGNVYSITPTNGLYIRHTTMNNFQNGSPIVGLITDNIKNVFIENCKINSGAYFGINSHNIRLINSCMWDLYQYSDWEPGAILFDHCTIFSLYSDSSYNFSAVNSVFKIREGNGAQMGCSEYSSFQSCVVIPSTGSSDSAKFSNGYNQDCIFLTKNFGTWDKITKDNLISNGCNGNDGTVMGHLGGSLGFSLNPSLPFIQEKDIKVDEATGVLKVQLKIGGLATETEPEPTPEPKPED